MHVLAHEALGLGIADDHVDRAAHGGRIDVSGRHAHGPGEHLLLAGDLGGVVDIRRGFGVGGLDIDVAAALREHRVAVDHHGHGRAHAGLSRGRGQAARDDPRVVAVLRGHVRAAGHFDGHVVAQRGRDVVAGDGHGERARQAGLALALGGGARGDGARDGLGVGVLAGQEVQAVRQRKQLVGGQVDLGLVIIVAVALLQVDQARVGVRALLVGQGAGIRHQVAHVHQVLVVAEGDFLLLGI